MASFPFLFHSNKVLTLRTFSLQILLFFILRDADSLSFSVRGFLRRVLPSFPFVRGKVKKVNKFPPSPRSPIFLFFFFFPPSPPRISSVSLSPPPFSYFLLTSNIRVFKKAILF